MMGVLDKLEKNVVEYARKGLKRAALSVSERERQNIGLTDHDYEALAKLGHPYGYTNTKDIHTPLPGDVQPVHIQSGKLHDFITIWSENKNSYTIGLEDWANPPYALDVVEGRLPASNKPGMIPRDFPAATLLEVEAEGIIFDNMEAAIDEGVRRS